MRVIILGWVAHITISIIFCYERRKTNRLATKYSPWSCCV